MPLRSRNQRLDGNAVRVDEETKESCAKKWQKAAIVWSETRAHRAKVEVDLGAAGKIMLPLVSSAL